MYETDEEQIEAIKKWFARWGNLLIGGLLAIIVGYGGFWFYQDRQEQARLDASDRYQQILQLVGNENVLSSEQMSELDSLFADLVEAHPNSTYTVYTALMQARFAAAAEDLEQAEERLRWALEQARDDSLKRLVNLRLARVQFAQGDHDAVLATLDAMDPGSQRVGYAELRGDVHASLGDRQAAREAYSEAWELAQSQGLNRPLLQAKAETYGVL
ncbi:MAG: tetratricopeptide repeat protein [Natronospirillum sp.]|uniref:YfgM family protein n=1 Tax=Natronospirillum sp. TaxID=2812955 RepID=UPI0025E645BB|nr:tetratricopeptide repeat protein [Natronospirillum sp.]MCH8550563.1 tetratricopeptide repeat protein [Natronospirillum sp.]